MQPLAAVKNSFMKYRFPLLILLAITILQGCDMADNLSRQLRFLVKLSNTYGGEWVGGQEEGCYRIEIKNSERLIDNPDSIEYHGTLIARTYLDSFGYQYPCLLLRIKDETGGMGISTSTTESHYFDFGKINEFKDRPLREYLTISRSLDIIRAYNSGNAEEANTIFKSISPADSSNAFVLLARAFQARYDNQPEKAISYLDKTGEAYKKDAPLAKYIGIYYSQVEEYEKAIEYLSSAYNLKPERAENAKNLADLYLGVEEFDSAVYFYTKAIASDSAYINAYFGRALSHFRKGGETASGCADLEEVKRLAPEANLPDSLNVMCVGPAA